MAASPKPVERFRAAVVRRSRFVAWSFPLVVLAQAIRTGSITMWPVLAAIIGTLPAFLILQFTDWRRLLEKPLGQLLLWAITLWLAAGAALSTAPLSMRVLALPTALGVVALSGASLGLRHHTITTIFVMVALTLASASAGKLDWSAQLGATLALAVVAAATGALASQFVRTAAHDAASAEKLARQQTDFERLYAVTTTLAGADSFPELLPKLVGTICHYLEAEVGVVMLHRPLVDTLTVVSPIWVAGQTLAVGTLELPARGAGELQRVFGAGTSAVIDQPLAEQEYGVLAELGLRQALVAPLRIENETIGLIAVGDHGGDGPFRPDQLAALDSLAAPAALVVSQMGRYEAAAAMSRRMEEMATMKSDFVSVVSHELRTPLTSIIGSLDTLVRPELDPRSDSARQLLVSARRQATRLRRLIEDLLTVSRIDRGSLPMHPEAIRLIDFLTEQLATVPGLEDVSLKVVPPTATATIDPDHLGRVLINLLDNAAKYAPGGPVEMRAESHGSTIEIAVVDHGPGIRAEKRGRAFERFGQLENADTRSQGGTGLGLSIVKGLTEAMGGTVELENTPGGGATFVLRLPATPGGRDLRAS
ncbi:MAG TPA: ATP-binding protein [Acidimicrobiia bacterium]|nr:ATP-binding protein [Acidimicrobiia bacterium]